MASGNMARRIADAELQMMQAAKGEWNLNVIIGGAVGTLQYAQHAETGERRFDAAFINDTFNPSGKGRAHYAPVDFTVQLGMTDAEYHSIISDAAAAGVIDTDQMRSVLHISGGGE